MGQVFRPQIARISVRNRQVLIPDEWGKSSDAEEYAGLAETAVLIPDEWGKSSDVESFYYGKESSRLNPR